MVVWKQIVTRHYYVTSFLSQNSWLMLLVLLHLLKTRNKSYFDFNDNVTIPCEYWDVPVTTHLN